MPAKPELEHLVQEWRRRRDLGEEVAPEELCRDCPELCEALREAVAGDDSTLPSAGAQAAQRTALVGGGDRKFDLHSVYMSLGQHGRGGLGEVYLAQDLDLGRQVAVKFLKELHLGNPETRQQFLLEAEITGQLDHPGVVPVYGCGQMGDQPFYVMRFVSGGTLEAAIKECQPRPTLSQLKRLIGHLRSACETVAYAHSRGIVHCDIKPGNILLGKYGETLVADWGSAIPIERDERAKASGEKTVRAIKSGDLSTSTSSTRPWTPAYMSPEQIPDSPSPIGPASDVFSLGATLYQVLVGHNHLHGLFQQGTPNHEELYAWIRAGKAPPPRQVHADVPPALDAICRKAMGLTPATRYRSALEMANDLEAWRTDSRVSVYRLPALDRALRWARRHRAWSAVAATLMLVAVVGGFTASAFFRQAARTENELRAATVTANARLAAEMLAYEIDLRWHVLERKALDAELRQWLRDLPPPGPPSTDPPNPRLQAWLDQCKRKTAVLDAHSWMLATNEARLVARVPNPSRPTFDRAYRFRDYFHGRGNDLPENDPAVPTLPPIRQPHRSVVYRSDSDGGLLMNFTVPVWDGQPTSSGQSTPDVIGVLGMTMQVATLASLQRLLGADQEMVLADLRQTPLRTPAQRGLIVHHPQLTVAKDLVFLEGDQLARILEWHDEQRRRCGLESRSEMDAGPRSPVSVEPLHLLAYRDPARDHANIGAAVVMPVFVRGRGEGELLDTGLIVIAHQKR
ncbi:MAG TPA: serine/threonine-protein kinase [Gemmatales bacterium]|nr:serine/threonine-protein kinase [Gemmatales bacterium]